MTVTDKFIKYIELISIRKNISTKTLIYILIDDMMKNHKMSKAIISDRDKLFIFKFYKALIKKLEIKKNCQLLFTLKRMSNRKE